MADCLSLLHARQGGGTGLVLQLPRAARHVGHLCRGAPDREQGHREAWALGLLCLASRRLAQSRSTWRLGAPAMQGDVQA